MKTFKKMNFSLGVASLLNYTFGELNVEKKSSTLNLKTFDLI